jgi:hypothetical protein
MEQTFPTKEKRYEYCTKRKPPYKSRISCATIRAKASERIPYTQSAACQYSHFPRGPAPIEDERHSPPVLLVLTKWTDDDGVAFPAQESIAASMNCSLRWVRELQTELIEMGELKILGVSKLGTNRLQISCTQADFHPKPLRRRKKVKATKPRTVRTADLPRHSAEKGSADKEPDAFPSEQSVPIPDPFLEKPGKNQGSLDHSIREEAGRPKPPASAPQIPSVIRAGPETAETVYPDWYFEKRAFTPTRLKLILSDINLGFYPYPPPRSYLAQELLRATARGFR